LGLKTLAEDWQEVAEIRKCISESDTTLPITSQTQEILVSGSGEFYLMVYKSVGNDKRIVGASQKVKIDVSDNMPVKNIELSIRPALGVLAPQTLNVVTGQNKAFLVVITNNLPIPLSLNIPSLNYPEDALAISLDTLESPDNPKNVFSLESLIYPRNDFLWATPGQGIGCWYILKPLKKGTYRVRITASANGVESTEREIEVNVYSPEDIIKNMVLKPSTQSIKASDSLEVSLNFNLDLSIVSSLENLGSVPAGAQVKPVEVMVELWEEREVFGVHFDKKIAEGSIELQSSKSTQNAWTAFNIHGSDLGWWVFHGGDHKLYAKITVKYCIGEATCISGTGNNWGTIVVETPRVTVSVGS
jgi:hypothetical protein